MVRQQGPSHIRYPGRVQPWTLDMEGPSGTNLLDTGVELGVSIFSYAPQGRGILTSQFRSVDDFKEGGPGGV